MKATTLPSRSVTITRPVARSLYKSILRQAKRYDGNPVLKVYSPVTNHVLQRVLGMSKSSMLYAPNSVSYVDRVRAEFRDPRERTAEEVQAAFEAITHMKAMANQIEEALPTTPERFVGAPGVIGNVPENVMSLDASCYTAHVQETPKLEVGTLLLSHPLATSHYDRRVVLIVESHRDAVVGLVLDLAYTQSITPGNGMFPEVLWDHELCQGGPFHVDMTMPPTATVSVLHTGVINADAGATPPATTSTPFSWLFQPAPAAGIVDKSKASIVTKSYSRKRYQMHNVVIPNRPGSLDAPLYYSRVESLTNLSKSIAGADRKNVRVYWGSMQWTRGVLKREIAEGLWFPVTASPSFFRALTEATQEESKFPTEDELEAKRKERVDAYGADVQPPRASYPMDQPQCRREPLWDQVMWALGGEFRTLSGSSNPLPLQEHMKGGRNMHQNIQPHLPHH